MNTIIAQKQRYLPHTLETKYHAVKTYRSGCSIRFVCRKYKVSKASLMRWNKKFNGIYLLIVNCNSNLQIFIKTFTSVYSYLYIILSSIDARFWQPVNTMAASRSAFSLEIYISTP